MALADHKVEVLVQAVIQGFGVVVYPGVGAEIADLGRSIRCKQDNSDQHGHGFLRLPC